MSGRDLSEGLGFSWTMLTSHDLAIYTARVGCDDARLSIMLYTELHRDTSTEPPILSLTRPAVHLPQGHLHPAARS